MLTLLKVSSSCDWKGRPAVEVLVVGRSNDRAELVALQNKTVEESKAADIQSDIEEDEFFSDIEEDEDPRKPEPHNGKWEIEGERWEMEVPEGALRQLCGTYSDGGFWSTTYHILDIEGAVNEHSNPATGE